MTTFPPSPFPWKGATIVRGPFPLRSVGLLHPLGGQAVILPQVTFGIAVRMAVMAMLGGN